MEACWVCNITAMTIQIFHTSHVRDRSRAIWGNFGNIWGIGKLQGNSIHNWIFLTKCTQCQRMIYIIGLQVSLSCSVFPCVAVCCDVSQCVAVRWRLLLCFSVRCKYIYMCSTRCSRYGVATISRLPKNTGLFSKRAL